MLVSSGLAFFILNLVVCEFYDEYEYSDGYSDNSYGGYTEESSTFGFGPDTGRVRRFGDVPGTPFTRSYDNIKGALQKILPGHPELFQDLSQPQVITMKAAPETTDAPLSLQFDAPSPHLYGFYEEITPETDLQNFTVTDETEPVLYGLTPEKHLVTPNEDLLTSKVHLVTPEEYIVTSWFLDQNMEQSTEQEKSTEMMRLTTNPPEMSLTMPGKSLTQAPITVMTHVVVATTRAPVRSKTKEKTIKKKQRPLSHAPVRSTIHAPVTRLSTHVAVMLTTHPPIRSTSHVPVELKNRTALKSTSLVPVRSTTRMPVRSTTRKIMNSTSYVPVRSTTRKLVRSLTRSLARSMNRSLTGSPFHIPTRSRMSASLIRVRITSLSTIVTSSPAIEMKKPWKFVPLEIYGDVYEENDEVPSLQDFRDILRGEKKAILRQNGNTKNKTTSDNQTTTNNATTDNKTTSDNQTTTNNATTDNKTTSDNQTTSTNATTENKTTSDNQTTTNNATTENKTTSDNQTTTNNATTENKTTSDNQTTTTNATTENKTTSDKQTTTTSKYLVFDIESFLALLANLTYDYDTNLTEVMNMTLRNNTPTCAPPDSYIKVNTTTSTTTTTTTPAYEAPKNLNNTVVAKCFVCGLKAPGIPYDSDCADAFAGDFLPLTPVNPIAKSQTSNYRKYCRYGEIYNYAENVTRPRSFYGRWTGGCSVRWTDLTGLYTQRTCRNRKRAITGLHYASKRMAKLEMALGSTEQGCIISPVATLLPLSRGVSLFSRIHACVCTGNWCNGALYELPSVGAMTTVLVAAWVYR